MRAGRMHVAVPAAMRVVRRGLALQRFPVPTMGDSITEGTLLELTKQVGEYVDNEEVVAVVETDKVRARDTVGGLASAMPTHTATDGETGRRCVCACVRGGGGCGCVCIREREREKARERERGCE